MVPSAGRRNNCSEITSGTTCHLTSLLKSLYADNPVIKTDEFDRDGAGCILLLSSTSFRLLVDPGATVSEGDGILVLEAMKMEMPISATTSGNLAEFSVSPGDQVAAGDTLALIS